MSLGRKLYFTLLALCLLSSGLGTVGGILGRIPLAQTLCAFGFVGFFVLGVFGILYLIWTWRPGQ